MMMMFMLDLFVMAHSFIVKVLLNRRMVDVGFMFLNSVLW